MSTRDDFIQKTCQLLELQGYHATGLNQIIKESGAPRGSLYYHFPGGKEELAAEAVKWAGQIVLKRIHENLALYDDPAEAIRQFIINIACNVEQSGYQAGGPITSIAMESAASSDALRQTCEQIYVGWQQAFADKLRAAHIAAPRAERLSVFIIAAIEGGVILCRTQRSPTPLQQIAEELAVSVNSAR